MEFIHPAPFAAQGLVKCIAANGKLGFFSNFALHPLRKHPEQYLAQHNADKKHHRTFQRRIPHPCSYIHHLLAEPYESQ